MPREQWAQLHAHLTSENHIKSFALDRRLCRWPALQFIEQTSVPCIAAPAVMTHGSPLANTIPATAGFAIPGSSEFQGPTSENMSLSFFPACCLPSRIQHRGNTEGFRVAVAFGRSSNTGTMFVGLFVAKTGFTWKHLQPGELKINKDDVALPCCGMWVPCDLPCFHYVGNTSEQATPTATA